MAHDDDPIVGKEIIDVQQMDARDLRAYGWGGYEDNVHANPPKLLLEDGTELVPSRDPEGNGPGQFFGTDAEGDQFWLHVSDEEAE